MIIIYKKIKKESVNLGLIWEEKVLVGVEIFICKEKGVEERVYR